MRPLCTNVHILPPRCDYRGAHWGFLPVILWAHLLAAQDVAPVEELRRYKDGPITIEDYRAKPPQRETPLDAITTTDLKYEFAYRVHVAGRRATAYVTEVTVDAILLREESWNRRPEDKRLLDHEQGHFDITCAWALKARCHFAKLLNGPNRLTSVSGSPDAAVAGLHKEMERQMQPFFDGMLAAHHRYDELTAHGTRPGPQADQRKSQRAAIFELTTQLDAIKRRMR